MASLTKKLLGGFALAALIATPTAACAAEDASSATTTETTTAANENVAASTAGQTRPQFMFKNAGNDSEDIAITASKIASTDRVTVIIWGGTPEMQREVFQATQEFMSNGSRVGLVIGPDRNNYAGDAEIEIYSLGHARTTWDTGADKIFTLKSDTIDSLNEFRPSRIASISYNID